MSTVMLSPVCCMGKWIGSDCLCSECSSFNSCVALCIAVYVHCASHVFVVVQVCGMFSLKLIGVFCMLLSKFGMWCFARKSQYSVDLLADRI